MAVGAGDERRHAGVSETWSFDLADPAAGVGVLVRLAFRPAERVAWWWAAAVGWGRPLVALRAHDVPIPARGTEIRTDGLWASLHCEDPLEHWSVGLECFGVGYDDPWDALGGERGDIVPFGLDLEWEADGPCVARPDRGSGNDDDGYGQWCTVTGEVLLGDDRHDVTAVGHRQHAWGAAADLPARSLRIHTADGRRLWGADGWTVDAAGEPATPPASVTPLAVAPFAVPSLPWVETLCRAGGGGGWAGGPPTPGRTGSPA